MNKLIERVVVSMFLGGLATLSACGGGGGGSGSTPSGSTVNSDNNNAAPTSSTLLINASTLGPNSSPVSINAPLTAVFDSNETLHLAYSENTALASSIAAEVLYSKFASGGSWATPKQVLATSDVQFNSSEREPLRLLNSSAGRLVVAVRGASASGGSAQFNHWRYIGADGSAGVQQQQSTSTLAFSGWDFSALPDGRVSFANSEQNPSTGAFIGIRVQKVSESGVTSSSALLPASALGLGSPLYFPTNAEDGLLTYFSGIANPILLTPGSANSVFTSQSVTGASSVLGPVFQDNALASYTNLNATACQDSEISLSPKVSSSGALAGLMKVVRPVLPGASPTC